ncbi:MAG: hypothetical protein DWQ02_17680 [Bacteroidetes bacterium]|nr:MAG: hypothetical protein DWQ02_17680 [Bacteroidota bacterium]
MKIKKTSTPLFLYSFVFILIAFFGCKSDDDQLLPSYIKVESVFGCADYRLVTPDVDFQINLVHGYEDFLVYGGFDSLVIADEITGDIFLREPINVNKLVEFNSKLMVCSYDGIYEIDEDGTLTQKSDVRCREMILTSDNELILTTHSTDYDPEQIYLWDEAAGLLPYNTPYAPFSCVNITKLVEAPNGDIWAMNCFGRILRFRDKTFLDIFDGEDFPLDPNNFDQQTFMLPYGEDMVVVAKNGIVFYQVLKYHEEEWITLFEFLLNDPLTDQEIEMRKAEPVITLIKNDKLYVGTSHGGCRGTHVFDISKNELLLPEDYYVVKDPELEGQCIMDVFESDNGYIIVVTLEHDVTIMNCN